jgi:hypothetical protein
MRKISMGLFFCMFMLIEGPAIAGEDGYLPAERKAYVLLGAPSLDFGIHLDISTPIGRDTLLGVTRYAGAIPMAGGGTNTAINLRSFVFGNSFFLEGRAGYMATTWGHPESVSAEGPSWGFTVGNHWFYKSGFHQGISWFGYDGYIKRGSGTGLPRLPRYELGFSF